MRKIQFITMLVFLMTVFTIPTVSAQANKKLQSIRDIELKLYNNKILKLNQLKGKVVILDFWFRGCFPCLQAVPELIKLQEEFKDDLVIIGINDKDIQEDVTDYFNYKKANYVSTYQTSYNISEILEIAAFPTIIILNKNGDIITMDSGYSKSKMNTLRKAVKKAVKDK